MNIILLVIDTLRYDYVAFNGNDWIRTPNLDALAGRSWSFDRALANSFPTIPQRTDVITGRHGGPFHPWAPLRLDALTLPRVLADAGYATQLIHDTPHLVNGGHAFDWPFAAWTFVRGAEVDRPWIDDSDCPYLDNWKRDPLFDYLGDPELKEVRNHVAVTYARANRDRKAPDDWNAAKLFDDAARFLRDNARRDNFFLWVDCFDPHEPWDPPPEYAREYDQADGWDGRIDPRALFSLRGGDHPQAVRRRLAALYAGNVSWVDHCLGRMLAALEERSLAQNTAVIVTADHGTNVGGRKGFGKKVPIHENEAHVPLIVHVPGRGSGRSDLLVQPQDIFATVLGIAGVDAPDGLDSHDVLALAESGGEGPRRSAVCGNATHLWKGKPDVAAFTVFEKDWYLQWAPSPEACRLRRYGCDDELSGANAQAVERLRQLGLAEMARREIHPDLLAWLESRGQGRFPRRRCPSRLPKGFAVYWSRSYNRW